MLNSMVWLQSILINGSSGKQKYILWYFYVLKILVVGSFFLRDSKCVQKRVSFPYSGTRLNNNEKIQATGVVYFRAGIMSSQRRP